MPEAGKLHGGTAGGALPKRQAIPRSVRHCAAEVRAALEDPQAGVLLVCEPSLESILIATGVTYLAHAREDQVRLADAGHAQPRLLEQAVFVPTVPGNAGAEAGAAGAEAEAEELVAFARRVWDGLGRRLAGGCPRARGGRCPARCLGACRRRVVYAAATDDPDACEACLRYLRLAFAEGARTRELIADERVCRLNDLARYCENECEKTRQFVRFSRMQDGTFAASFRPRADTVPLVAAHFASRMGPERFVLVDPVHRHAALHEPGRRCVIIGIDAELAARLVSDERLASDERYVRALWKRFYDGMALEGRDPSQRGYDLRASWMPKRFWGGLTELDPRSDDPGEAIPDRYQGKR